MYRERDHNWVVILFSCNFRSCDQANPNITETTRERVKSKALERLLETLIKPEDVEERYEVLDHIGNGGFGVVSKVRDFATGALYAMKKLPFDNEGETNDSIKREIFNIIKMRSHENIVQWYDIFRTRSKQLAIVMDLCDMDLETFLKSKQNRTCDILFDVALQITAGIAFLHTHNPPVIHRDIKPQNILIKIDSETQKFVVKIADFGLSNSDNFSQVIDDATKAEMGQIIKTITRVGGTLPFLAPEFFAALDGQGLINGRFRIDASVDIFALGLVFAFMFCYDKNDYG